MSIIANNTILYISGRNKFKIIENERISESNIQTNVKTTIESPCIRWEWGASIPNLCS